MIELKDNQLIYATETVVKEELSEADLIEKKTRLQENIEARQKLISEEQRRIAEIDTKLAEINKYRKDNKISLEAVIKQDI